MSLLGGRARPSRAARAAPWREAEYLVVDLESTSARPREAEPLSVGWVPVVAGRVRCAEAAYTLVRGVAGPSASLAVHGLTPDLLATGAEPEEVAGRLRRALEGRVLVAHHAALEVALLGRWGLVADAVVDTLALVRALDERAGRPAAGATLGEAARRYDVPAARAHHAFGDAWTTALLLLTVAGGLEAERGRCTLDDLLRLGG